jgi:hypothetical protein
MSQADTDETADSTEELDVADARDVFFVQRDEQGELLPKEIPVPGRDVVVPVLPATEGVYNEYLDEVPWKDNEKMARLFTKQFPDLEVSAFDLENDLLSFSGEVMVQMIREASGEDMQSQMAEERERQQTKRMMDMLGLDTQDMSINEFMEAMSGIDEENIEDAAEDVVQENAEGAGGGPQPKNENPNPDRPDKRRGDKTTSS